jgi:hypothetical protein
MRPEPGSIAVKIVVEALTLRKEQPQLPAVEVLDHVMRGHFGSQINFDDLATPPAPFALLIAEAFDRGMQASDWAGLWRGNEHPQIRPYLLSVWRDEIWPIFMVRYSLY